MKQDDELGLARLFRAESGKILSSLLMLTRDFDLAEDAIQDALLQAGKEWPTKLPNNKASWLYTVAKRRLIDRLRKEKVRQRETNHQAIIDLWYDPDDVSHADLIKEEVVSDESLRLIFTCAHPALAEDVRVPLTLKTLSGLTTREIARAYLCSEAAMGKRLTRAKRKIKDAGIAYQVPKGEDLNERLDCVLSVLYLMYNESYSAFEGQTLTREDLALEAIRLARLVYRDLPCPEAGGLLALLLLHHARHRARQTNVQSFVPLEHQDRSQWNSEAIQEGVKLALGSLAKGEPGPYQVQAAISALHSLSPSWEATDWKQITQLYEVLYTLSPSHIVRLNQAMALAYSGEIEDAFKVIIELEKHLDNYQPYFAARAEIESNRGDQNAAIKYYDKAILLTNNEVEKKFLQTKKLALKVK